MSQSRTTLVGDQSFILVTLMYDLGVTLLGEIRNLSVLGSEG